MAFKQHHPPLTRCALVLVVLAWACPARAEHPSERAFFFHYAAVQADLPALCAKIPANAQYTAGFNPAGYQIYALRSKCYFDTALRHAHPELCEQVQPVSTPHLSGSKISSANCRARIGGHVQIADPLAPSQDTLLRMFAEMGYHPDNLSLTLLFRPRAIPEREFLKLHSHPATRTRVLQALRTESDIPAADLDILRDMAGVLTNDIAWCQQIDPSRALSKSTTSSISHTTWNMASWCIFKVAFNTDNATLCELLPKQHEPGLTTLYSLAGQCRANIAAFHDPKNTAQRGRYGFNPVPDADQRARLFRHLGYAEPMIADIPRDEMARRLRYLLKDIGKGRISREDSQVQVLLAKLQSLAE